ncbi:MAG TPA: hypothetical protein PLI01_00510 [Nitrospira sp.]|nr:hypothetical protein [Nitrospira sp.]HNA25241.1 hypothetical protein [Nitrospira sp.]
MRESRDLIPKLKKHLKETYGASCHKYHGGPFGEAGHADLFGTLPGGRAFYFEAKVPGNTPTQAQLLFLEKEAALGAVTGVVTSVQDVDKYLLPLTK